MRAVVLTTLLAAALPGAALAGDPAAGKQKAQTCAVCHGPMGIAVAPETPNLAGEGEGYLTRQLQAFRSGKRQHEVMNVIARPLTDAEIGDLAAWFASLKIELKTP